MMILQILAKEIDSAALACCMTDEGDRFRMDKIRCNLFVVRFFLWNMISLVVGFLPMDQMMLKAKWIKWLDGDFVLRPTAAEIVVDMGGTMIDDHNHSPYLMCFRGFSKDASFF